ncbi:MAG: BMP family ABC transporter substrate-binding protein, partial [Candidatus Atribacteria bacterium]|nr:BMP family ABC transporter substrate-binding protein [Candidatus Atribacteria bacterium]
IYRAIDLYLKGELRFGVAEGLGIKEGGVGVADNENFKKLTPEDFRKKIKEIEEKILAGEIIVDTAF